MKFPLVFEMVVNAEAISVYISGYEALNKPRRKSAIAQHQFGVYP
jgi:hypothetical protein